MTKLLLHKSYRYNNKIIPMYLALVQLGSQWALAKVRWWVTTLERSGAQRSATSTRSIERASTTSSSAISTKSTVSDGVATLRGINSNLESTRITSANETMGKASDALRGRMNAVNAVWAKVSRHHQSSHSTNIFYLNLFNNIKSRYYDAKGWN